MTLDQLREQLEIHCASQTTYFDVDNVEHGIVCIDGEVGYEELKLIVEQMEAMNPDLR